MKLETIFENLATNRKVFARFIHTLSFLEYIGARKILKSQDAELMSLEVLTHASEEIRHAKVLKKLAEEIEEESLGGYKTGNLLCGEAAEAYFQTVDLESSQVAERNAPLTYALTTLLVEERAMKVYPILEIVLAKHGFPGKVGGILKEEERHLKQIHVKRLDKLMVELCQTKEEAAFHDFLTALVKGSDA